MQEVKNYSAFLSQDDSLYGITVRESRRDATSARRRAARHVSVRPPHLKQSTPKEHGERIQGRTLDRRVAELESRVTAVEHSPFGVFESITKASQARFSKLVEQWKDQSITSSSFLRDRLAHPAYLGIIGMGREALPLILLEMSAELDHWGPALAAITGENPVRDEDAGNIEAITRAWLRWALAKGLRFGDQEEEELQGRAGGLAKPHERESQADQRSDD